MTGPGANPLAAYAAVTGAYWGFTLTDGALRMLVLLHFHRLGYSPLELALLFVLYELCGVVTNLVGGWIGARLGLRVTLWSGLSLQIAALVMLAALDPAAGGTLAIAWVVAAQGLSGIAKDLTKMSAKSAVKSVAPAVEGALFRWVAALTGSKNALKGVGFFLGGALLEVAGFAGGLWIMAGSLALVLAASLLTVPAGIGRMKARIGFRALFAKSPAINRLSAARFFLFGAHDAWFVVGLPLFLYGALGWRFTEVGGFLALWTIGYGAVQAAAPAFIRRSADGWSSEGRAARLWAFLLAGLTAGMTAVLLLPVPVDPGVVVVGGLCLFGLVFAVNSAVHSYLVLAYSRGEEVALDVGFYYMANAGGRLAGTLISGAAFMAGGIAACLAAAAVMAAASGTLALGLPTRPPAAAQGGSSGKVAIGAE